MGRSSSSSSVKPADDLRLTENQIAEFRQAFVLFDKDGDGHVTLKELQILFSSMGQNPTEEELKGMIAEVDADGSGEMEFEEVHARRGRTLTLPLPRACAAGAFSAHPPHRFYRAQFCRLMIKNGKKDESEETLREAFKILDKDGSGEITKDELRGVLNAFSQSGEEISDADIDAMIKEADVDGDGSISFDEVRHAAACLLAPRARPLIARDSCR